MIEDFDGINKSTLDVISENMESLAQLVNYCAINKKYYTTMEYCVVKYVYVIFTLQEDIKTSRQVIKTCELAVQDEYLVNMKSKKNWYW